MKIFYSHKQVDELLPTLKVMVDGEGIPGDFAKMINETLKHSYKGTVIYFYKRLTEDRGLCEAYFQALKQGSK